MPNVVNAVKQLTKKEIQRAEREAEWQIKKAAKEAEAQAAADAMKNADARKRPSKEQVGKSRKIAKRKQANNAESDIASEAEDISSVTPEPSFPGTTPLAGSPVTPEAVISAGPKIEPAPAIPKKAPESVQAPTTEHPALSNENPYANQGFIRTAEQIKNAKAASKNPNWWMKNTNERFNNRIKQEHGENPYALTGDKAKAYREALEQGPSTMDHIIGNNVHYGAAALLGTAGVVNMMSRNKGRQSNSQLYGQS